MAAGYLRYEGKLKQSERKGVRRMPWGKMAVLGLAALVTLGLGLVFAQPWDSATAVGAIGLDDDARREEEAFDDEVRDGDDDDLTHLRSSDCEWNGAII